MAVISDLKFQKNKKRVNVFLDDAYYCALQYETVVKHGLKVGDQIEKLALDDIQSQSEINKAKEIALGLIEKKLYTVKELKTKLKEKGFLPAVTDQVCQMLAQYGYVDDRMYAKCYCLDNGRRSKKDLMYKLKNKGVLDVDIAEQLDEIDPAKEKENCMFWAQKFLRRSAGKTSLKQKLCAHLASKGFGFDTIRPVVEELLGNVEEYD